MKTKEIAFTLPVVIILYEFIFFEGKIRRRLLHLTPLCLTILIIPLSLIGVDKHLGDLIGAMNEATRAEADILRWDYLFTQFRVESSVIPTWDVIFEHRVYLPSVGAIIAFSTVVFYAFQFTDPLSLAGRHRRAIHRFFPTVYLLLTTLVIALSIATYQRNAVWQD